MLIFFFLLFRLYHPETIETLNKSIYPHVIVSGKVTYVKYEDDGDYHFRLTSERNDKLFIICEIIPTLVSSSVTIYKPSVGDIVIVKGIHRYDNLHEWDEIHPVENVEKETEIKESK